MPATKPLKQAFDQKWASDNAGCHLWNGSKNNKGYGQLRHKNKCYLAHRISWLLTFGDIPDGKCILHKCDVPACVNPAHLFLGSKKENTLDMLKKGRNACGKLSGIAHPMVKLANEQVISIRADHRPQRDIAIDYGVKQTTISAIKRMKTWRHL